MTSFKFKPLMRQLLLTGLLVSVVGAANAQVTSITQFDRDALLQLATAPIKDLSDARLGVPQNVSDFTKSFDVARLMRRGPLTNRVSLKLDPKSTGALPLPNGERFDQVVPDPYVRAVIALNAVKSESGGKPAVDAVEAERLNLGRMPLAEVASFARAMTDLGATKIDMMYDGLDSPHAAAVLLGATRSANLKHRVDVNLVANRIENFEKSFWSDVVLSSLSGKVGQLGISVTDKNAEGYADFLKKLAPTGVMNHYKNAAAVTRFFDTFRARVTELDTVIARGAPFPATATTPVKKYLSAHPNSLKSVGFAQSKASKDTAKNLLSLSDYAASKNPKSLKQVTIGFPLDKQGAQNLLKKLPKTVITVGILNQTPAFATRLNDLVRNYMKKNPGVTVVTQAKDGLTQVDLNDNDKGSWSLTVDGKQRASGNSVDAWRVLGGMSAVAMVSNSGSVYSQMDTNIK